MSTLRTKSGIIFGLGLTISGMVYPQKVLGFLNIFDAWDPSLMFVMVGAIFIFSPLQSLRLYLQLISVQKHH